MVERFLATIQRRPRAFDFTVAFFWTALSFTDGELWEEADQLVVVIPAFLIAGGALYWRRRYPKIVFGVQALLVLAMAFVDVDTPVPVAIVCGTYSLAAHGLPRQHNIAAFVGFVTTGFLTVLVLDAQYLPDVVVITLILTIAWVVGDSLRTRRAYQQSVLERAERAEALRDSLAHQAVAEERARIARDLHDVVAHSMSLMVVQAGAARRVVTTNPDASIAALEAIESVGRNSLGEMRRILGVLRGDDEGATTAPQPDLDALEPLVEEFRSAGLPVKLTHTGRRRPLAPSVELTAFRIVQESLTNTLKHAGPATAQVVLDYNEADLHIVVEDDGRAAPSGVEDAPGSQKGHVGMRERVLAFGGDFSARPRLDGGYRVSATLPLGEN